MTASSRSVRRTLVLVVGLPTLALVVLSLIAAAAAANDIQRLRSYRDSVSITTPVVDTFAALRAEAAGPTPERAAATDAALAALAEDVRERPGLIPAETLPELESIPDEIDAARARARLTPYARGALARTLESASGRFVAAVNRGTTRLDGDGEYAADVVADALSALHLLGVEQRVLAEFLERPTGDRTVAGQATLEAQEALRDLRADLDASTSLQIEGTASPTVERARLAVTDASSRAPSEATVDAWQLGTDQQIDAVSGVVDTATQDLREVLDDTISVRLRWLLGIGLIIVGVTTTAVGLAVRIAGRMARRIESLRTAAAGLSAGRLDGDVEVGGNDEIAAVGSTLNELHTQLRRLEGDVRRVATDIAEHRDPPLIPTDDYPGGWVPLTSAVNGAIDAHKHLNADLAGEVRRQEALRAFGDRALGGVSRSQLFEELATTLAAQLSCRGVEVWEAGAGNEPMVRRAVAGMRPIGDSRIAHHPPGARPGEQVITETRTATAGAVTLLVRYSSGDGVPEADRGFVQSGAQLLSTALSRIEAEQRAIDAALHDPVTELPNGRHLNELLRRLLAVSTARNDVSVIHLDVDDFQELAGQHTQALLDDVLAQLAARFTACITPPDIVGHLGAGRFVVATPQSAAAAEELMGHLGDAMELPVTTATGTVHLQASIGYTEVGRHDPRDADAALQQSEVASHWASSRSEERPVRFDAVIGYTLERRNQVLHGLREVIERPIERGFGVVYQPVIDLTTRLPMGVEALARWHDPEIGFVPPDEFVQLAERSGIITQVGPVIARLACLGVPRLETGGAPLSIGINASAVELATPGYAKEMLTLVEACGVDPAVLVIEVTETSVIEENEVVVAELSELRRHGVKVAVDDFGTGYASLGYLTHLPVDSVKIDREFISGLDHDERRRAVVAAVTTLAHDLGFRVVAEGVERMEELRVLRRLGCDLVQGYLLARPAAAADLEATQGDCRRVIEELESGMVG